MNDEIYLMNSAIGSFEQYVTKLCEDAGLRTPELRSSDHVASGQYAVTTCIGIQLKLALADDPDYEDFDYVVSLKLPNSMRDTPDADFGGFGDILCRSLTRAGWRVARSPDGGLVGGRRYDYDLNDNGDIKITLAR